MIMALIILIALILIVPALTLLRVESESYSQFLEPDENFNHPRNYL